MALEPSPVAAGAGDDSPDGSKFKFELRAALNVFMPARSPRRDMGDALAASSADCGPACPGIAAAPLGAPLPLALRTGATPPVASEGEGLSVGMSVGPSSVSLATAWRDSAASFWPK